MSYNKFEYMNDICQISEEITDIKEYKRLEKLLKNNQDLPDGYFYTENEECGLTFFKECSDEDIKAQLEISNAKSLKSIAASLQFFKTFTIISLGILIIGGIVAIALLSNSIEELNKLLN